MFRLIHMDPLVRCASHLPLLRFMSATLDRWLVIIVDHHLKLQICIPPAPVLQTCYSTTILACLEEHPQRKDGIISTIDL